MMSFPSVAIASLSLLTITLPAYAETITYDFTVNVTEGSLSGNTFTGTFSYDDATLQNEGIETLGLDDGLTVTMEFLGDTYTEVADVNYPDFPKLVFEDGEIRTLDFWMESGPRVNWWALPGWAIELQQVTGDLAY